MTLKYYIVNQDRVIVKEVTREELLEKEKSLLSVYDFTLDEILSYEDEFVLFPVEGHDFLVGSFRKSKVISVLKNKIEDFIHLEKMIEQEVVRNTGFN